MAKRLKAIVSYDKWGQHYVIHPNRKSANEYYQHAVSLERWEFYFLTPEQLELLTLPQAVDMERKLQNAYNERQSTTSPENLPGLSDSAGTAGD